MKRWRVVVLLSAACSGSSQDAPPVVLDELTGGFAQIYCDQFRRCCTPQDFGAEGVGVAAVVASPGCVSDANLLAYLDDEFNLGRLKQSVRAQRAHFDGMLARTCLSNLRALSCQHWIAAAFGQQAAMPDACREMVQGTVAIGGACQLNFEHECESGSCDQLTGRTCVAAPGAGERCPARCEDVFDCSARCARGLRCGADNVCAPDPQPEVSTVCSGH